MNGYPYPVLTETDSSYIDDIYFKTDFLKYCCKENNVVLSVRVLLNSNTLNEYIADGRAELIVKVVTDIRSLVFHCDGFDIDLVVESKNIRSNDTITIVSYIVAKTPFALSENDETKKLFGENFCIDLRKGDVLAESNKEKLNYNTTNNDFIMIKSADDMEGKGIKIRLSNENHIEILVGSSFKHAYAILKDPKVSPILNSHIVFDAIVYALVEISQQKEDYSEKEWYRLFSQAYEVTGETLEDFKQKSYDEGVDMAYVYEQAQAMISNSLENSIINVSKMGN